MTELGQIYVTGGALVVGLFAVCAWLTIRSILSPY